MEFIYKNVLIMGYGNSGKSMEKLLMSHNIKHSIYDENLKLRGGQFLSKINKKKILTFDLIVISPGFKRNNKVVLLAQKLGIKVIGEIELAYMFCPAQIIAVTGTDGKTTTVNLIHHILVCAGKKSALLGNVGIPFSDIYKKQVDYCVLELSSFQLETIDKFVPTIGVILNISADHMERYQTEDDYIKVKIKMFKNATKQTRAVLNYKDKSTMENSSMIIADKYYINREDSLHVVDGRLFYGKKRWFSLSNLCPSPVFYDDILASVAVAMLLKIDNNVIQSALNSFMWLKHRMEVVQEVSGVKYINDSKATNFHSALSAIKAVKDNVVLLMGGHHKGMSADDFFADIKTLVKKIVFFGKEMKSEYKKAIKCGIDCVCFENLPKAMSYIKANAEAGDNILFSPCYSSFDAYNSYEERGEDFVRLVKNEK